MINKKGKLSSKVVENNIVETKNHGLETIK